MVSDLEGGWLCFINEHPHLIDVFWGIILLSFKLIMSLESWMIVFTWFSWQLKSLLIAHHLISPFELGACHWQHHFISTGYSSVGKDSA